MTATVRFLTIIRDAADPFGTAQPAELLKAAHMDRNALARGIGDLAKKGLVEIDEDSGAVSLTLSGRRELLAQGPPLPSTPRPLLTAGIGTAPQPEPPAAERAVLPTVKMKTPAPQPSPGTEPWVGTATSQVAEPPSRRGDSIRKPRKPLITKQTAAEAVKQAKDVAVAIRQRGSKKPAEQARRSSRTALPAMESARVVESVTRQKTAAKSKRPKKMIPKVQGKAKVKTKRPMAKGAPPRRPVQ